MCICTMNQRRAEGGEKQFHCVFLANKITPLLSPFYVPILRACNFVNVPIRAGLVWKRNPFSPVCTMLSLPEDITSFTKKGGKGYYIYNIYFSHMFLFHFLFLLDIKDKGTSCQRLFMQLWNLISASKEFWIWKRFCLSYFTIFNTVLPLGSKKFGYLDMKWGNEKYAWFSTVYIHPF